MPHTFFAAPHTDRSSIMLRRISRKSNGVPGYERLFFVVLEGLSSAVAGSGATVRRFAAGSTINSSRHAWHRYTTPARGTGSRSLWRIWIWQAGHRQGIAEKNIRSATAKNKTPLAHE